MEIIAFGLPFYFIAGLAYEATAFFIYLAILIGKLFDNCKTIIFVFSPPPNLCSLTLCFPTAYKFALRMLFGVLAQTLPKKANVQGVGTFLYLLLTLTSGFIVWPIAIPSYWKWLFYVNPMAWSMQGMASNQFLSSKFLAYECEIDGLVFTLSESALMSPRGWASGGRVWIGYSFAFLLPYTLLFGIITWLALKYVRIEPDRQHVKKDVSIGKDKKTEEITVPFIPVDLSFENLVYEVTASTSKDKLRLLNEVSGVFKSGR